MAVVVRRDWCHEDARSVDHGEVSMCEVGGVL